MDDMYKIICKKLGCEPNDVEIPDFDTEDDNYTNPFSALTSEESDYLLEHGYFG